MLTLELSILERNIHMAKDRRVSTYVFTLGHKCQQHSHNLFMTAHDKMALFIKKTRKRP